MGKDTLEQLPCFDKVYGAVHESIKHWKRICAYIKAELYDDDSDKDDFDCIECGWKVDYGDTAHGNTCPLCKLYENDCDKCILKEKYNNDCNYEGSPWYRTIASESWEDMLKNAQDMVKFLEKVMHELVEERQ